VLLAASSAVRETYAAPLTTGNLVVLRLGTGLSNVTTGALPVFFDEYTTSGSLVQSIALPTTTGGALPAMTLPVGAAASDMHGMLETSRAGYHILFSAYEVNASSTANYVANTVRRNFMRMDLDGTVEVVGSTIFQSYTLSNVASDDGATAFWYAGVGSGIYYLPRGSTNPTQIIGSSNYRSANAGPDRLYAVRGGGSSTDVQYCMNGGTNVWWPTANVPNPTVLTGKTYNDHRSIVWKSPLELYSVDYGAGIWKLTRTVPTTTTWTRLPTFAGTTPGGNGYQPQAGITGALDAALGNDNTTLFVSYATGIYSFDTVAQTWNNAGQPIITAGVNTWIRGITIAPVIAPSPTPSPTASITPTVTPTISGTPTVTPSPTTSKSTGASDSPTPTSSRSITGSNTPSRSITGSPSSTRSITATTTPTISITSSRTPTISVTPSTTASATMPVDIAAIRNAAEAGTSATLAAALGGSIGGFLFLVALGGGVAFYISRRNTAMRKARLRAGMNRNSPGVYSTAWSASDHIGHGDPMAVAPPQVSLHVTAGRNGPRISSGVNPLAGGKSSWGAMPTTAAKTGLEAYHTPTGTPGGPSGGGRVTGRGSSNSLTSKR